MEKTITLARFLQHLVFAWVSPGSALIVFICSDSKEKMALVMILLAALIAILTIARMLAGSFQQSEHARREIEKLAMTHVLTVYPIEAYVDSESLREVRKDVRIVAATPRLPRDFLINYMAFPSLLTPTLIVRTPPHIVDDIQSFFIYHEAGHISSEGSAEASVQELPLFTMMLMYIPSVALTGHWASLPAIAFGYWLDTQLLGEEASEAVADHFAITRLTRVFEKNRISKVLKLVLHTLKGQMMTMKDPAMKGTRAQINERLKRVTRYLNWVEANNTEALAPSRANYAPYLSAVALVRLIGTLPVWLMTFLFPRVPSWKEVIALAILVPLGCIFIVGLKETARDEGAKLLESLNASTQ
jgi:hypothetical protein